MAITKLSTVYRPSFHHHPLYPSARFVNTYCGGCNVKETIYGGYYCNELDCPVWFVHKKCAEASLEINHPSHPQHPLLLTSKAGDGLCNLCENFKLPPFYSCSTCQFKVDLLCGMKLSPSAIQHPLCHDHPLAFLKSRKDISPCEVCNDDIQGPSYLCHECNLYFHLDCVNLSKEVDHPCHSKHPIILNAFKNLMDDAQKICFSCKQQPKKVLYHCSICNFSMCLICTRNPPPIVIEKTKTHIHPLILFPKTMPFTCDVCGEYGKGGPYVCPQCAFFSHGECIDLPRVININRHDHCISFTPHLGAGYSECGVCRKSLSQYHGAYSCSVCPKYASHFKCAVRESVWDLVELKYIPNHTEYIEPFIVVGDDLIAHFSHEQHRLKLYKYYILYNKLLQCEACLYPIGFEPIYACEKCGFVLHEKCANLPRKKRVIFQPGQCSLEVVYRSVDNCMQCGVLFYGFKYRVQGTWKIDVLCGSLSEPLVHDGHSHPLYFYERSEYTNCDACEAFVKGYILHCDACNFNLCCYCASLPLKIWHMNDDHPINLYCGVKVSIESWCDICERELDQCKWFYTCYDCEVTFHTRCVFGDFSRLKPKTCIFYRLKEVEVVRNNNSTRPLCSQCHSRCKASIILRAYGGDNGYICSYLCLLDYLY